VVAAVLASACGAPPAEPTATYPPAGTVVLGSFDFPESDLLIQLYGRLFEANGFPVTFVSDVGPREVLQPALWQGMINFVPEYAGSALDYFAGEGSAPSETSATLDLLRGALARHGVEALEPAPAQNQNVVVVTSETAFNEDVHRVSDLSRLLHRDPALTLGGPPECPSRDLCLPGLRAVYGLRFQAFLPLSDTSVTAAALKANQIQVGVMFSTDGALSTSALTALRDDRALQPAENIVPLVRTDLLTTMGANRERFVRLTNDLSSRLSADWLRTLNARVASGRSPELVARVWLEQQAGSLMNEG
jgi:osmoprotectant transport system substrate-binding protein